MRKILVFTRDPGGTRVIAPVLVELQKHPEVEMKVVAGAFASTVLSESQIRHQTMPEPISLGDTQREIAEFAPSILFGSTGFFTDFERLFRKSAHEMNIPVISILDFWANYKPRWPDVDYDIHNANELIGVMDDLCKKEMVAEGFHEKKIMVVGHPHLEKLWEKAIPPINSKSKNVRILFLSERLEVDELLAIGDHPVKRFAEALAELKRSDGFSFQVLVKKHPNEKVSTALESSVDYLKQEEMLIDFDTSNAPALHIMSDFDWIIGYSTMGLFEASIKGKKAIGINVRPVYPSLLEALRYNHVNVFNPDKNELREGIKKNLNGAKDQSKCYQGSTKSILKIALEWNGF